MTKPTILCVDDEEIPRTLRKLVLQRQGYEVADVGSGKEALELLLLRHFDLVLTDQLMPGMTGSELASRIRAENALMPIILATGYAELSPGEAQGLPRLAKPFSQRELAEAIARAVGA